MSIFLKYLQYKSHFASAIISMLHEGPLGVVEGAYIIVNY